MIRFAAAAGETSHEVLVGPIEEAAEAIAALAGGRTVPLISDEHVLGLHGERLRALFDFQPVVVPRGEAAKDWPTLISLIEAFSRLGVSRRTAIVALGGGSVGDVTGLAASLFKRGCPVIHVPTTLLSQADSALGGKTAIDALGQKNLLGTFHPPALVIADPAFLATLDQRQLRSGYAEVVKYGLIDDAAFFAWCEENGAAVIAGDAAARLHAIEHCLRAKARIVSTDLRDLAGRRALLNLGHSFGHAIEARAGFERVLHGEAVAAGMALAFAFSASLGLCEALEAERVAAHLRGVGLPASLAEVGLEAAGADLLPLMRQDKKADGGVTLILTRGIGRAFVARDVNEGALEAFLHG